MTDIKRIKAAIENCGRGSEMVQADGLMRARAALQAAVKECEDGIDAYECKLVLEAIAKHLEVPLD